MFANFSQRMLGNPAFPSSTTMTTPEYRIFVCTKQRPADDPEGCCTDCGALEIHQAFKQSIAQQGLHDRVQVKAAGCLDHCTAGAVAMVFQPTQRTKLWDWPFLPKQLHHKIQTKIQKKIARNRTFYGNLTAADVEMIVQEHCINHQVIHGKVVRQ
ncbi:(2Fe-2S) ferredoxin domain-containing protein [filamentous cyanobacterium LEGE 11480]|uniref:(2Fe-2S) ferredoxin domain-containing protein n=1 Tax=Romeriopsis navalis LEGE 11480 TaxID=2777977 RepID=A0A928VSE1_9CYAN|nr:(2Fe-2S) ferredoxin domain-containing protein [Romeriopsis navalis]MBE9031334.1 (2Fe-2S) ferredoxin domain-containing protein [Romeriopsis navalis LEGE 11480]